MPCIPREPVCWVRNCKHIYFHIFTYTHTQTRTCTCTCACTRAHLDFTVALSLSFSNTLTHDHTRRDLLLCECLYSIRHTLRLTQTPNVDTLLAVLNQFVLLRLRLVVALLVITVCSTRPVAGQGCEGEKKMYH